MSLNVDIVPMIKQKREASIYRQTKQAAHTTVRGKGKVAQALKRKKE